MKLTNLKTYCFACFKPALLIYLFLFIFYGSELFSQAFLPLYEPAIGKKQGYIILKDSTKIEGTFKLINHTKNIKSCIVKDKAGKKHSLKAAQIEKVYILVTGWDKMNAYGEFTISLQELLNLDFDEIIKPEYYVWEHTLTQKKGKVKIMQLVNPGFASKIKVFRDTSAMQESSSQFTNGVETSFYVEKKGTEAAMKVKKKTYKVQFQILFGDCPKLIEALRGKKPKWSEFASHVYAYDQLKK